MARKYYFRIKVIDGMLHIRFTKCTVIAECLVCRFKAKYTADKWHKLPLCTYNDICEVFFRVVQ